MGKVDWREGGEDQLENKKSNKNYKSMEDKIKSKK